MVIVSRDHEQKFEENAYRSVCDFYITSNEELGSENVKGCATGSKALNVVTEEIFICIGLNKWQKFGTEEVIEIS